MTGLPGGPAAPAVLAIALLFVLGGCGPKPEPPPPAKGGSVSGSVEMEKPAGGGADAGTAGGHRRPGGEATTRGSGYTIRGTVRPAGTRVTILNRDTRERARADVSGAGSFRARAARLRRGVNHIAITGRRAGLSPWRLDVTVTRKR